MTFKLSECKAVYCTQSRTGGFTEGHLYPVHHEGTQTFIISDQATYWFEDEFPIYCASFKPVYKYHTNSKPLGTMCMTGVDEHANEPEEPTIPIRELILYIDENNVLCTSTLKVYLDGYKHGVSKTKGDN